MIATVLEVGNWIGSADQVEWVRQFARDYSWEGELIEDPEHAADTVVAQLAAELEELHPDARSRMLAALTEAAEKATAGLEEVAS